MRQPSPVSVLAHYHPGGDPEASRSTRSPPRPAQPSPAACSCRTSRPAELRAEDPGRAILPLLRHHAALRNQPTDQTSLAFGAIDGRQVPAPFIEEWELTPRENAVVLASDGYPVLGMTLDESEDSLTAAITAGPLHIDALPGTKPVRPGSVSFDDRAYVRLEYDQARIERPSPRETSHVDPHGRWGGR